MLQQIRRCSGRYSIRLVRQQEEVRGYREPQGLRGFEVDDQLVLRWLLHGKVGGLSTLQYLVDKSRGTTNHLGDGRPIREQAASFRLVPPYPYRRQPVLERKVGLQALLEVNLR